MTEESFLTVNQAAIILKVHPLSIRRYIKEGKLAAIKAAGLVRIPQSALDNFGKEITGSSSLTKRSVRAASEQKFSLDDPIFRLKGRGLSIQPM